jgi:hypothetical protein
LLNCVLVELGKSRASNNAIIQPNRIHRCNHSPSALAGTGLMRAGWGFENAEGLPLGATI